MPQQLSRSFDAVQARQTDIHQHDVRTSFLTDADGLRSGLRFRNHGKLSAALEQRLDAVAHDFVVFDNKQTVRHGLDQHDRLYLIPLRTRGQCLIRPKRYRSVTKVTVFFSRVALSYWCDEYCAWGGFSFISMVFSSSSTSNV